VRLSRLAIVLTSLVLPAGCYTLVPVSGTPAPGSQVALEITDAGRVALGSAMGPGVDRVEGRLIENTGGEYLVGVTSVAMLRGGVQTWKGEHVVLRPDFVSRVSERRFSRGRTAVAVAAGIGLVAYVASRDLLGSADKQADESPLDTAFTRRSPGPRHIPILSFGIPHLPFLGRP